VRCSASTGAGLGDSSALSPVATGVTPVDEVSRNVFVSVLQEATPFRPSPPGFASMSAGYARQCSRRRLRLVAPIADRTADPTTTAPPPTKTARISVLRLPLFEPSREAFVGLLVGVCGACELS
jgi:hypothetical protein